MPITPHRDVRCASLRTSSATRSCPSTPTPHTETSLTGLQTTRFREQARDRIRRSVGADGDYAVIFCGSGATGAVNRLIDILNIRIPADLDAKYRLSDHIPAADRPVIFIGPYEHHSNELPWRETIADVVPIPEDADGRIDLAGLEAKLVAYNDRPLRIGSFSAASNVTGIRSDTAAISAMLHRHGAYSFWDFAAAGPYVDVDVAGREGADPLDFKDAVFMSPHKFVGGPGSPGLLVVHKNLLRNRVPSRPGGGTVAYVSQDTHRYLTDAEHREEGGTPAIVESIRAGLAFQLKDAVGTDLIQAREEHFVRAALDAWGANPNIRILGNPALPRLGIISLVFRHGTRNLHHDFAVALLNDLFGIQARGGCSCAGPYGHRLLGIGMDQSRAFETGIVQGCNGIKPGWVRVGFNYFLSERMADYIIQAVSLVADHGWKMLPYYRFEPQSGLWLHRDAAEIRRYSLEDLSYADGVPTLPQFGESAPEEMLDRHLAEALAVLEAGAEGVNPAAIANPPMNAEIEALRWFCLPSEVAEELAGTRPLPNAVPGSTDAPRR